MAVVTICSDFQAPQIRPVTASIVFPSICHEVMGPDAMILVFRMLSFKPTFSLSSFIKRLFSSSLSAIRVVSSAYLRLLIFLPAILIPSCASSSSAFLMRYSAYNLNKEGDHMQPWHTSLPIWNQSVVSYPVLTVLTSYNDLNVNSRYWVFIIQQTAALTFCHKGGVMCISEVIDVSHRNPDSSLCFIQPKVSHYVLCI